MQRVSQFLLSTSRRSLQQSSLRSIVSINSRSLTLTSTQTYNPIASVTHPDLKPANTVKTFPIVQLPAKIRFFHGRQVSNALRDNGEIPAVIFNRNNPQDRVLISLNAIQMNREIHRNRSFCNRVYEIKVDEQVFTVIPRHFNQDPMSGELLSIEFTQYEVGKSIKLDIPVEFIGIKDSNVTKQGGVIHTRGEFAKCIWDGRSKDIPECITCNVTYAPVDTTVLLQDCHIPEGLTPVVPNLVVAKAILKDPYVKSLAQLQAQREAEEEAAAAATAAATATATGAKTPAAKAPAAAPAAKK